MRIKCITVGELQTNCYLVWNDPCEAYIIDPGDEGQQILDAVRGCGLSVRAVILTHVHYDHILAVREICDALGVPLYVGRGDQPALTDSLLNLCGLFSPGQSILLTADRLLSEGDVLTSGSEQLRVMETPGHTPGSICLVGERIMISGDTLFCGSVGRTDFPGGDVRVMHRSLTRLKALNDDYHVYPGHGDPTTLDAEIHTNPYLQ